MAERKRLHLGNLNPIYARKLNKLDVHQVKGRWNLSRDGEGGNACWHKSQERGGMSVPTVEGEGVAQGDRDVQQGRHCRTWQPYVSRSIKTGAR